MSQQISALSEADDSSVCNIIDFFSCWIPFDKSVVQSSIFSKDPLLIESLSAGVFFIFDETIGLLGFDVCMFMVSLMIMLGCVTG